MPGPGTYKVQMQIDPVGKYMLSTYNNSKASKFNEGRRFSRPVESKLEVPGPGTYESIGNVRDGR